MKHTISVLFLLSLLAVGCGEEKETAKPSPRVADVSIRWMPFEMIQKVFPSAPKPLILYVMDANCDYCDRMDSLVLSRPEIADYLNRNFFPVKVDVSTDMPITIRDSALTEGEFRQLLRVDLTPTFLFFDPNGQVIGAVEQEFELMMFKHMLVYIKNGHYLKRTEFEDFLALPEAQLDTVYGVF